MLYKQYSLKPNDTIYILNLVKFFKKLLTEDTEYEKKTKDNLHSKYKFFFYGPSITGLTIDSQIQFSVDIQARGKTLNSTLTENERMKALERVHHKMTQLKLKDISMIKLLNDSYNLDVEESYKRKKRNFLQIQKQVLLL